jgi:RNA polymerase sigma-54 factor
MQVSHDQTQQIVQTQKIAPHLIQASELLQCSVLELGQTIERELMENPALECIDTPSEGCAECGSTGVPCPHCPLNRRAETASPASLFKADPEAPERDEPLPAPELNAASPEDDAWSAEESLADLALLPMPDYGSRAGNSLDNHSERFDPLSLASSSVSLHDHLLSVLRSTAEDTLDYRVGEYLVNCLDERGWLQIEAAEAMADLRVGPEALERGIRRLQACDPAGVGARDLRECLLLQLRQLHDEGSGSAVAMAIVEKYWEGFIQRRFDLIARRAGKKPDEIQDAVRFIQTELSPAPASRFREPWDYKPDSKSDAIRPDVIVRRSATGFEIEVIGQELPTLHINARYRRLYEELRTSSNGGSATGALTGSRLSPEERKHIIQYVERAHLFIKNVQQRQRTIERITRCLIEAQQGFIETGSRAFLFPITRTDLARQAGFHESTVSRALLHKYIQLPNQDVLSFDVFFAPASSIKDSLAQMIAEEDPHNPYSDEALRKKLAENGVDVARRTIVKYRESLRIPASYLRRRY